MRRARCHGVDWASHRVLAWRLSNTLTTDFCPCDKPIGPGLRGWRGASKKTGVFSSMSYWEMTY